MPNNTYTEAYTDYFRQLAVRHTLLQHDTLTEESKGDLTKKAFAIFGNNEIIQGLRGELGKTALCIELFENTLSNETIYEVRQKPKGSLMVIDLANDDSFSEELRAYVKSEKIMYDLLKQIWQDHYGPDADQCARPFKQFRFVGEITPTGRVFTRYYGWYLQFDFDFQNTINITEAPAPGTFDPA